MKKLIVLLTALIVIAVTPISMAATVHFDDGRSHLFSIGSNYNYNDVFYLDRYVNNDPGTRLELVSGRYGDFFAYHNAELSSRDCPVGNITAYNNSSIRISGGWVRDINAYNDSHVTINAGSIGGGVSGIYAHDNSVARFSGSFMAVMGVFDFEVSDNAKAYISHGDVSYLRASGNSTTSIQGADIWMALTAEGNATVTMGIASVANSIVASDNSTVTINGGVVENTIDVFDNSTINLHGANLKIDGIDLSYGDRLSDFATLVEYRPDGIIMDYYTGTITGRSGWVDMNSEFKIYNTGAYAGTADIIIIPEPCTLALLGLGILVLRRRKAIA